MSCRISWSLKLKQKFYDSIKVTSLAMTVIMQDKGSKKRLHGATKGASSYRFYSSIFSKWDEFSLTWPFLKSTIKRMSVTH